jgi:hypothetical protein
MLLGFGGGVEVVSRWCRGGVEVVSPPEVRADLAVTAAVVARYG